MSIRLTTDEKIAKALLNTIHLQAQHTALSLSFLSVFPPVNNRYSLEIKWRISLSSSKSTVR